MESSRTPPGKAEDHVSCFTEKEQSLTVFTTSIKIYLVLERSSCITDLCWCHFHQRGYNSCPIRYHKYNPVVDSYRTSLKYKIKQIRTTKKIPRMLRRIRCLCILLDQRVVSTLMAIELKITYCRIIPLIVLDARLIDTSAVCS